MYKREKKFLATAVPEVNVDQRIIQGYFSRFTVDQSGDLVRKGAFKKTIKERGPRETSAGIRSKIKLGFNHGEVIGIPVMIMEDDTGGYFEGKVSKTELGDRVLTRIDDGSLDSCSFEYSVIKAHYPEGDSEVFREILEAKVYEMGPVDYPMNEDSAITGRKSFTECIGEMSDRLLQLIHKKDVNIGDIKELKALYEALTEKVSVAEAQTLPEIIKQPSGEKVFESLRQFSQRMKKK